MITSIEKLYETGVQFVFTDGHSYAALTQFFNSIKDLDRIDSIAHIDFPLRYSNFAES